MSQEQYHIPIIILQTPRGQISDLWQDIANLKGGFKGKGVQIESGPYSGWEIQRGKSGKLVDVWKGGNWVQVGKGPGKGAKGKGP